MAFTFTLKFSHYFFCAFLLISIQSVFSSDAGTIGINYGRLEGLKGKTYNVVIRQDDYDDDQSGGQSPPASGGGQSPPSPGGDGGGQGGSGGQSPPSSDGGQSGSGGQSPPSSGGGQWCVANEAAGNAQLQEALDWACGDGKADCAPIQPGADCFEPDTLAAHASYAFNSYYQKQGREAQACDFKGSGKVVTTEPHRT